MSSFALLKWIAKSLRPSHLLACLLGVMFTGMYGDLFLGITDGTSPDPNAWWESPVELLRRCYHSATNGPAFGVAGRVLLLLGGLWVIWAPVGGFVARSAYLRDETDAGTSAARFVRRWAVQLWGCGLLALAGLIVVVLPVVLLGLANRVPVLGPLVASAAWGVPLVAGVVLAVLVLGSPAWTIMPAAVSAEGGDSFDALSRGYTYWMQYPVTFLGLTAFSLALAAMPLIPVFIAEDIPGPAFATLAALAMSVFWSAQALVYLRLRRYFDGEDEGRLYREGEESPPSPRPPQEALPPRGMWAVWQSFLYVVLALIAHHIAFYLFAEVGGERTEWAGWGMGETFAPQAHGAEAVASLVAGGWLAAMFVFALMPVIRAAARSPGGARESAPPYNETGDPVNG